MRRGRPRLRGMDAERGRRRDYRLARPVSVEHRPGGIVARNPADPATAPSAGAAQPHVRVLGLDPPATDLLAGLSKRPGQVAVEDVPARHSELGLELGRGERLESEQAVLDRLGKHAVD